MGAMQRRKGKRGEYEVRDLLRRIYPGCQRRACGEESIDKQGCDIKGTPGLCVQVNLSARPPFERKLKEAVAAAEETEIPVAFCRKTPRGEWIVTLRAEDFIDIWDINLYRLTTIVGRDRE